MPEIQARSRGPLLDGTAPQVVRRAVRRWMQGTLRVVRDYARDISPVLTGRYRTSLRFRTRDTGTGVEGELYSDDVAGKVRVIEYGFPPARPELKGRVGRYVFGRTYGHYAGLLGSQTQILAAELVRDLGGR